MKKILSLITAWIILLLPIIGSAAWLQPSLTLQMQKQEKINKKNDHWNRLKIQEEKKQAAKDRIAALKYKQLVKRNISLSNSNTNITQPISTLAISRPPLIQQSTPPVTVIQPNTSNITPSSNIPTPQNVDISRVRATWIGWYNSIRQSEWLWAYSYDTRLDSTAYDWNLEFAKWQWQNHHRRNPSDSYYSFPTIDTWFMNRWIDPIVINRSKHTENVWYGTYSCNSGDCTESLIRSIRSTFDFFMSEKWKAYDAHYRSIVNPYFTKIGLSIIVVPNDNRYYITVHYITE